MCQICEEHGLEPQEPPSLAGDLVRMGGAGALFGLFMFLPGGPLVALGRSLLIGVVGFGGGVVAIGRFLDKRAARKSKDIAAVFYPEYCETGAMHLSMDDPKRFNDLYRLAKSEVFREYYQQAKNERKAQELIEKHQRDIDKIAKLLRKYQKRERKDRKNRERAQVLRQELALERAINNDLRAILSSSKGLQSVEREVQAIFDSRKEP